MLSRICEEVGNESRRFNGDDSWELPSRAPLISRNESCKLLGRFAYRRRLEPAAILDRLANPLA